MYTELRKNRGLGARGRLDDENQDLLWLPRSAVVAAISALDAYVHQVVRERLSAMFAGPIPPPNIPTGICDALAGILQIKSGAHFKEAVPLLMSHDTLAQLLQKFDQEKLQFQSFQAPDKIIEAYGLIGELNVFDRVSDLWPGPNTTAADLRRRLTSFVQRRNQIAHEGDLERHGAQRPMQPDYALSCRDFVVNLVTRLDQIVFPQAANAVAIQAP